MTQTPDYPTAPRWIYVTRRLPLLPFQWGRCRWCGEKMDVQYLQDGTPDPTVVTDHPRCLYEIKACSRPRKLFYKEVVERDGERCHDCGRSGVALQLDHEVPLWKVWRLPPGARRPFFLPGNLRLRCPACHARKTAAERAEAIILEASSVNYEGPQGVIERLISMYAIATINWLREHRYIEGKSRPKITEAGRKFLAEIEAAQRRRALVSGLRVPTG